MTQSEQPKQDDELQYILINATNVLRVIDDQIDAHITLIKKLELAKTDCRHRMIELRKVRIEECQDLKLKFMELINNTGLKRSNTF